MATALVDTQRVSQYIFRITQLNESPHPYVLHFDCAVGDLRPWFWPITDAGHRVTPDDLISYRASGFRRPCCLCAVPGRDGISPGYTESILTLETDGEHAGGFTLTCARGRCAYMVPVEHTYVSPGLPLKRYTRHYKATSPSVSRNRYLRRRERGIASGIRRSAPLAVDDSPFVKLIRLNSSIYPGLPEDEFKALFTKCRRCSWIMTQYAFKYHNCPLAVEEMEVIDLTLDDDED